MKVHSGDSSCPCCFPVTRMKPERSSPWISASPIPTTTKVRCLFPPLLSDAAISKVTLENLFWWPVVMSPTLFKESASGIHLELQRKREDLLFHVNMVYHREENRPCRERVLEIWSSISFIQQTHEQLFLLLNLHWSQQEIPSVWFHWPPSACSKADEFSKSWQRCFVSLYQTSLLTSSFASPKVFCVNRQSSTWSKINRRVR